MESYEILKRVKQIEQKLKKYSAEEEKLAQEGQNLQDRCEHEIIITTIKKQLDSKKNIISIERSRTYCLFCKQQFMSKRFIPKETMEKIKKSARIYMEEYPKISEENGTLLDSKLEKLFETLVERYPYKNVYEISKIMKEELTLNELKFRNKELEEKGK